MAGNGYYGQDGFSMGIEGAPTAERRGTDIPAQPVVPASRGVIRFIDNGDGTLTAAQLLDVMAEEIDIQFEAGAMPVAAIAPKAFMNSPHLRSVILPGALRVIGEMAFSGCPRLTSVSIPGGVARVGTLAFAKCQALAHVRVEPGVGALGPSCFSKCQRLLRVDLPASVQSFGGGVFFGCPKQLVIYGAEGTKAQQYARFNGVAYDSEMWREDAQLVYEEREDGALVVLGPRQEAPRVIEIPTELCGRRIAEIAPKAFFANATIERVVVGCGVERIGQSAFFGCLALASVSFERGLQVVCDSAFAGCERLTQVTLPWGLAQIGRMAFFGCQQLRFVKMPPTTRVADLAFDGCAQGLRVFGGVYASHMTY